MVLSHATHAVLALVISLGLPPATSNGAWPLDPRPEVREGFAPPQTRYGAGHRGVDLVGASGQQVRAAAAGVVSFAGSLAGRGVVVVSHGATRTTYEPVAATVRAGQRVGPGDQLGTLQLFGSHCWPAACLHWGLIEGETYLDPLSLVGAGPVRLLPLAGSRLPGGWTPMAGPPVTGPPVTGPLRPPTHLRLPGDRSPDLG